jgi:acetyl esterase
MNLERYQALMDPELRPVFELMLPLFLNPPEDPVATMEQLPLPKSEPNERVLVENRRVSGPAGAPDVPVRVYTPAARTTTLPGLLWIHGGGFTTGQPEQDDALCERFVEEVGSVVVSVDYRLAPEHPFPAAPEDCYAALRWMAAEAAELGIDSARIAVGGCPRGARGGQRARRARAAFEGCRRAVSSHAGERYVPGERQAVLYRRHHSPYGGADSAALDEAP